MAKPKPKPKFQPSPASLTVIEQTRASLRYVCKAAESIEQFLLERDDVPSWVLMHINQAAMGLGMALTYLRRQAAQKEDGP